MYKAKRIHLDGSQVKTDEEILFWFDPVKDAVPTVDDFPNIRISRFGHVAANPGKAQDEKMHGVVKIREC